MATFWATFGKIMLLSISTSGHNGYDARDLGRQKITLYLWGNLIVGFVSGSAIYCKIIRKYQWLDSDRLITALPKGLFYFLGKG